MDYSKLGFASGFFTFLIVFIVIGIINKKKNKNSNQYDERQEYLRGKGYKIALYVHLFGDSFLFAFNKIGILKYIEIDLAMIAILFLSTAVFTVYCIFNDCFFTLKERPKSYLIFALLMGIFNFVIAIGDLNEWIDDGKIYGAGVVNFYAGITFLIVSVSIIIKLLMDRKEVD